MKRRFLWLVPLLFLTHVSWAQTALIQEIGMQGFYSIGGPPTRVRVQVSNPDPQPLTLNLTLSVTEKDARFGRVDRFDSSVTLQGREVRSIDLPVPLFASRPVLTLDAAAGGRTIAHQSRILERPQGNALIILLCAEDKTCNEVLGTIGASGSDQQKSAKTKSYTFLVVKELPEEWWIYGPAHGVILARPASGLNVRQRDALDGYARLRGQIVLVENLTGPGLLDDYHVFDSAHRINVGTGSLLRFPDPSALAAFLDRSVSDPTEGDSAKIFREHQPFERFLGRSSLQLATTFEFPTLRWLMIWLIVYILTVGALNFFVLTRIDRRELAWITVPAVALFFAVLLYFTSAAKRPTHVGLDEIATYYMDDRSPRAAGYYDLRISSPHRQDLALSVPGQAVWNGADRMPGSVATFSVFDRTVSNSAQGWSMQLIPERRFEIPLLQWSYQDLSFSGVPTLPGTIRKLPDGQLSNETGISFRRAVYLADLRVYDLGAVAAGAKFPPGNGPGEDEQDVRRRPNLSWDDNGRPFNRDLPGDIKQFLVAHGGANYPVFIGLADAPSLGATLPGETVTRRQYVIVVVGMRGAP